MAGTSTAVGYEYGGQDERAQRQGELRKTEVFEEPQREGQGRVDRQPHGERLNQARRQAPKLVAGATSGIGINYAAPRGADRRVGNRVPDLPLAGGGRLYAVLRDRRFVLVRGGGRGDAAARYGWRGPVTEVTAADPAKHDLLVRPDGHLASVG